MLLVFRVRSQSMRRPMSYCDLLVFTATPFSNPIKDSESGHKTRRHNYCHDEDVRPHIVHLRFARGCCGVSTRGVVADAYAQTQLRCAHLTGGTSHTDAFVDVLASEAGVPGRAQALVVAEWCAVVIARPQVGAPCLALRTLVARSTPAGVSLTVIRQLTPAVVVAAWRTCPHARPEVYRAHAQGTVQRFRVVPEHAWIVEVGSRAGVVPPSAAVAFAVCTLLVLT